MMLSEADEDDEIKFADDELLDSISSLFDGAVEVVATLVVDVVVVDEDVTIWLFNNISFVIN